MIHFIHNGQLIPAADAHINISNIEWTYGFGVYENLKLRNGHLYFVDKHLERLMTSARLINLEHNFRAEQIASWLQTLYAKSEANAANIKILLIGGKSKAEANLYIMLLAPKFLPKKAYTQGVHTITKEYERFLPQAKTLNMLPSYLFFREAQAASAHDCLLIDHAGYILEGTRSNFFALKDKVLYTAPLDRVLNGVTRQTVIECAKNNGYKITEKLIKFPPEADRPLAEKKITDYDGAFLTHTSGNIVPIRSIDGFEFADISQSLKELMNLYNKYLKDCAA